MKVQDANASPKYHTADDVARILGVGIEIVLGHIRAGRIAAMNVGLGATRPRWRITDEALAQFTAARTASPRPATRPKRKTKNAGVIAFFE